MADLGRCNFSKTLICVCLWVCVKAAHRKSLQSKVKARTGLKLFIITIIGVSTQVVQ